MNKSKILVITAAVFLAVAGVGIPTESFASKHKPSKYAKKTQRTKAPAIRRYYMNNMPGAQRAANDGLRARLPSNRPSASTLSQRPGRNTNRDAGTWKPVNTNTAPRDTRRDAGTFRPVNPPQRGGGSGKTERRTKKSSMRVTFRDSQNKGTGARREASAQT